MGFKPFKNIRDNIHERKMARIEGKTDRVESRTERALAKAEAKSVAYEQGIDPNASMWQGVASLGQSAAKVAGGLGQAQFNPNGTRNDNQPFPRPDSTQGGGSGMIMIILAIFLFMFMGKK